MSDQSLSQYINISNAVIAFLMLVVACLTYRLATQKKKATKPTISLDSLNKSGKAMLIVTNKKPHTIDVHKVYCRNHSPKFIYKRRKPIEWEYPPVTIKSDGFTPLATHKITDRIKDRGFIRITIPNYDPQATYNILAKTSGGHGKVFIPTFRDWLQDSTK